ncbi:histone-lysine N-methyltransferase NSD2 isoform X1 [Periophthalmus magnuspinnatus]|uniref:histone-lysine N-methyltransferase NSD2 isoform X1 n=1 Tax=Periophthalmus magnuspinnatus TaxID=409849 RepID=UPI002436AC72|nr:histone-lysine N-methyltransferase NSD2 isoform X1 [Periophthalmus magnuspinnatus]
MDSIGSSLPSMPKPANPISMKQLPESLSVHKGCVDMTSDPALLMDKAAAQLAATLQDNMLQKMSSHNHEHLKDLTSLVLNGDHQDALPKLCTPEAPLFKPADAPTTNGIHQHNCSPLSEPELKVSVPQVVPQPLVEPCTANGTSLVTSTEDAIMETDQMEEVKKRRGRPLKPKLELCLSSSATSPEINGHSESAEETAKANELNQSSEPSAHLASEAPPTVQFCPGDLVWTKVSGYPWWPCIVTTDPEHNSHLRQKIKVNNPKPGLLYHVQYFGDAPERGYIFEKNLVLFTGEEQYQELSTGNRPLASRPTHKKVPSVPRKFQAQWRVGISQAKESLGLTPDQRLTNFSFVYDEDGPQLNPHVLEKLDSEPNKKLDQETQSRLSPVLDPASGGDEGTAKVKKTKLPLDLFEFKDKLNNVNKSKKKTLKDVSSEKMPESDTQVATSSTAGSSTQTEPVNKKRPKTCRPKTLKGKKKMSADNSCEPKKKIKAKKVSSTDDDLDPATRTVSLPGKKVKKIVKKTEDQKTGSQVKKERKKYVKRSLSDATSDKDQKTKKRKIGKDGHDQTSDSSEKQQKQKKKLAKGQKETKKTLKSIGLADDEEAEKPKYKRKRKLVGESEESTPTKPKKQRPSICPETEGSGSEGRPDSPSDSLDGIKKGERKKEFVCHVCEGAGEDLVPCEGQCCGMFHLQCLGLSLKPEDKLLCPDCSSGVHSCFSCKSSEGQVRRCHVPHCGKFYHEACVRLSPLTVFDNKGFRCPMHTCISCYYSGQSKHRANKGRLMRCLRCPVAYHVGDFCVAAGSETITNTALICTNHYHAKKNHSHHSHVNVSWCFVCSKGGQLLCCESCPAAFHPDCLNIAMPEGSWFCNDCRAGKKPKYRDIVWVKLGTYRWWPAEINHPRNVPTNIQHLRHEMGEFPVYFFGSKDYYWTHQGRVFPYVEGDRGSKHQRSSIGKVFKSALLEAEERFTEIKMKREAKEAQENSRKPPPYKFIKVNKPVGRVQVYTADISEIPKCNCKPSDERPCSFESECLNRMLLYECHPQVCPSGGRCCNQDFTKRLYPDTKIIKTPGKGWGLISLRDIKKGEFVNEYIGELIDEEECHSRIKYAQENNITNFYMLTIDKDRIIDAGPKGNYSRFMNHSCQPNCETQKWTVNGDTRVGLFAVRDIPAGTELTFNYNLDCLGNDKMVCRCGAPNCSGFLGDRPKNSNGQPAEPKMKRVKRKYKKRKTDGKKSEDECFRCGDGGQLVLCNKKHCTKAYHLSCLNLTKRPFGRWDCPWHHCDVCGKNSGSFCQLCPNSFCKAHEEGALRPCSPTGLLCCMDHEESEIRQRLETIIVTKETKCKKTICSKKPLQKVARKYNKKKKAAEA